MRIIQLKQCIIDEIRVVIRVFNRSTTLFSTAALHQPEGWQNAVSVCITSTIRQ
jgi:hypothetical protein